MPDATSEAGLQGRIVKAIKREWPSAWMFHALGSPYQTPGIPDLIVCIEGRFYGLEVKWVRPGETRAHAMRRTTPQQVLQLAKINKAGGVAATVTSVEEALFVLRTRR